MRCCSLLGVSFCCLTDLEKFVMSSLCCSNVANISENASTLPGPACILQRVVPQYSSRKSSLQRHTAATDMNYRHMAML